VPSTCVGWLLPGKRTDSGSRCITYVVDAVPTQEERRALLLCQTKIRQKKLQMEVVDAEYQWYAPGPAMDQAIAFAMLTCICPRTMLSIAQGPPQAHLLLRGGPPH